MAVVSDLIAIVGAKVVLEVCTLRIRAAVFSTTGIERLDAGDEGWVCEEGSRNDCFLLVLLME